jgi:hypothetical protein
LIKLEVKNATSNDKGIYNLIAKNEKGEVVSSPIEVKEVVEEKVEKPSIDEKLKSIVSNNEKRSVRVIFFFIFSTNSTNK